MRIDKDVGESKERLLSLDQFRGYTVAAMFLVNFIGGFSAINALFKHNKTYCSYADTIMPHFFFAVGFALRLTLTKRIEKEGWWPAHRRAFWRQFSLILLGVIIYGFDRTAKTWEAFQTMPWSDFLLGTFGGSTFQALVHIGVTGLWILPVIAASGRARGAFLIFSGALHLLLSWLFYFDWVQTHRAIDGGLLGFLTWTIPTLAGALAYDILANRETKESIRPLLWWALGLMLLGYGFSCGTSISHQLLEPGSFFAWFQEPPFMAPSQSIDLWTMSQKTGSLSYQTFSAGLSLGLFALFVYCCDIRGWQLGLFRTFGQNALLAYIVHFGILDSVAHITPKDSALWFVLLAFSFFFGLVWFAMRYFERNEVYLKL